MSLTTRRLFLVFSFLVILGGAAGYQFLARQKKPPAKKTNTQETRDVYVTAIENRDIPSELNVQGTLVAFDKIDIFSEVGGVLLETGKPFKIGSYFPKGSVLLKLDDTEARLSLQAQRAALMNAIVQILPDLKIDYPESFEGWNAYVSGFDPELAIKSFPPAKSDAEKFLISSRNLSNQYYTIKSAEARLDKYTLRAPFSGVITQSAVNAGSLVRAGQKMGELMNTSGYELQANVPLSDMQYIKVGNTVDLGSREVKGKWTGRIRRIADQIDASTQTVPVFVSVSGKGLKEGMYLKGEVAASTIEKATILPRDLLLDQNAVYAVKDSQLVRQPVNVVKIQGANVIVKGIPDGTTILAQPTSGAFAGLKVSPLTNTNAQIGAK